MAQVRRENSLDGWYDKQDGQTFGPVAAGELKERLAAGQLRPRRALWKQAGQSLIFVPSATAVGFSGAAAKAAGHPTPWRAAGEWPPNAGKGERRSACWSYPEKSGRRS
jgi:hypothetical protein